MRIIALILKTQEVLKGENQISSKSCLLETKKAQNIQIRVTKKKKLPLRKNIRCFRTFTWEALLVKVMT